MRGDPFLPAYKHENVWKRASTTQEIVVGPEIRSYLKLNNETRASIQTQDGTEIGSGLIYA
jgi:hypothetical protein